MHKFIKGFFSLLLLILGVIIVVVIVRTLTLKQKTILAPECTSLDTDFIHADVKLLSRFQAGVRFRTVSRLPGDFNKDDVLGLISFIEKSYPILHSSPLVTREVISNYSLLYKVRGSNSSLLPVMLIGHLDVVPVTEEEWEAPPFDGEIRDGFIYGRGTIDDKHAVFGILEAMEFLLARGHKPKRTVYLGFGHDEEVGGKSGAYNIAQTLLSRGIQLEFLMDEGMTILDGLVPGVAKPVALIGSSEKGRLTLKLSVSSKSGHSSMPFPETSIGILSRALIRLESNPHRSMFGTGPERGTFEHLAPEMKWPFRIVMSNLWLFSSLVAKFLSMDKTTNTVVRTTTAVVVFNAGVKENVIPPYAEALVNHRIHPSQTVQEVIDFDQHIIDDDRVKMEVVNQMEPLPKSPYGDEHFGWQTIKTSILQVWGDLGVTVAPGMTIGNTDTRHYTRLTRNIYRFSPTYTRPEDVSRFHGVNERISIKNYQQAVNFYYHLMINAHQPNLQPIHKHGDEL